MSFRRLAASVNDDVSSASRDLVEGVAHFHGLAHFGGYDDGGHSDAECVADVKVIFAVFRWRAGHGNLRAIRAKHDFGSANNNRRSLRVGVFGI